MRPTSRGSTAMGRPSTSSFGPTPGTGLVRPNSGRLATARLRTGVSPTGPGTQAAQGIALNMNVNVHDRPVTGQGIAGVRLQTGTGRIVEDSSMYVGILRKRINDISQEINRLKSSLEINVKDASFLSNLEKKHESLMKNKELLEGQLADYNLALDKTRTATDPDKVLEHAQELSNKNNQTGQELDRIFTLRKERETETQRIEDLIENIYNEVQKRINDLEPSKLRIYNDLMKRQKEFEFKISNSESQLSELNSKIEYYEKGIEANPYYKEFITLDKLQKSLKRDLESIQTELEISQLEPKEAHSKFVSRVNDFKQNTKVQDEKIQQAKQDVASLKKRIDDLDSRPVDESIANDQLEEETLLAQESEMETFFNKYDLAYGEVKEQKERARELIVALLEAASKSLEENSLYAGAQSDDIKGFKERSVANNQQTAESLKIERKKKSKELELLKSSEPKLVNELKTLKQRIVDMKEEMKSFQDMESLHRAFGEVKHSLLQTKSSYLSRRDAVKQQTSKVTLETENVRKVLATHEVNRDLDETEKRLRHNERTIFELNEYVDSKKREIDYESVKSSCLDMINSLNSLVTKKCSPGPQITGGAKW